MGQTIMIVIVVHSSSYYFPGGVADDSDGGSVGVISPVTQQRQSPELTVFIQLLPIIRTGILLGVQHDIAPEAYAQGLISKEVHRNVTSALNRFTPGERTDIFMDEVENRIENDAVVLIEFIDVLRSSDPCYGGLAHMICESSTILCYASP